MTIFCYSINIPSPIDPTHFQTEKLHKHLKENDTIDKLVVFISLQPKQGNHRSTQFKIHQFRVCPHEPKRQERCCNMQIIFPSIPNIPHCA